MSNSQGVETLLKGINGGFPQCVFQMLVNSPARGPPILRRYDASPMIFVLSLIYTFINELNTRLGEGELSGMLFARTAIVTGSQQPR